MQRRSHVFFSKTCSVVFCKHVGDGMAAGAAKNIRRFFEMFGEKFALKVFDILDETWQKHLGVMMARTPWRLQAS